MMIATTPLQRALLLSAPSSLARRHVASSGAAAPRAPRAPLQLHTLDGRYAVALFNAAARVGSLSEVEKDAARLVAAVRADAPLRSVLESPAVDRKMKATAVAAMGKTLRLEAPQTGALLNLMLENRRLPLLEKVCLSFATLMQAHRSEVRVNVTSHMPLDAAALKRIEEAVSRNSAFAHAGGSSKLRVVNSVNPAILGGLIVEVGDLTVDLSASTRISKITRALVGTGSEHEGGVLFFLHSLQ